jgi:DNA-binding NtrC family response regulator
LLEAAQGGTLFFDEVGEMSLALQAKLLRAIESRQILRVGGNKPREIDVRFVAATNRDLEEEVANKAFRQDLFFRLNGIALEIPPLRERREDIEPLARSFLEQAARRARRPPPALTDEALAVLRSYGWPGNVRELRNVVERALVLCTGSSIAAEHLPLDKMRPAKGGAAVAAEAEAEGLPLRERRERLEREAMLDALARCAGNQTRAAELLGMSRRSFCDKLRDYGIPRPRRGGP